jgi:hypothetical protein
LAFEALRRFIKQLEEEAVASKRTAKAARAQNADFDRRAAEEEKRASRIRQVFRQNIMG